ncbi:Undecaprenyl-phosphate alpha-N-acetylglucosaminyl 1-phosphate transferase [uncultured Eubacterium sp.]|uniref:MraY family glycosyltransferase n=1 Tax=Brotomerdimonas butyrica TaxID=2981721 RepID=UPI00082306A1|nr:MraY family glycosyltransferase [Brotomerdimonas butyrica]MCU6755642.1 undecaprenyl/decaprenyl-phosphate alpha-N-acetylglucosaminyl 1-phosphate transferase [Brotomerdimonas butyrica]SCH41308.1 Undecaprenyl-phosphate alpha-N-acetylglucosaminyl 1-phosphate transferase [uncultured Eubacterium sp.]
MTATSIELWGPLLVAFVVAAAVTPAAIKIAPKIGAMDIPKDERRMHKKPMPRFGGIAIYLGIMAALAVFALKDKGITSVMTGCTLIYMLGLIDDLKDLKPLVKLCGQIVCATVVYIMGVRIEFITNYFGPGNMAFGDVACFIITVLWLIAITNAVNLIDGLDGLAAGIVAISALCIGYVAYIHGQYVPTLAMMAIAGAALGFLPYNFNPAKIFMGDSGSELLGFSIAAVSILGTVKSATIVVVIIPALVLGLPIFDTVMAIFRRLAKHQSIGTADKDHLHHRIMKAGFGQKRAVMILYCISGIMGIVAVLYSRGLTVEYLGLTAVAIMLIYVLLSDTGNRNISLKADKIKKERPDKKEEKNKQDKHIEKGSDNK